MSVIAGMQDLRQQGPPADIGTFLMPCSAFVFSYVFAGTTYYCSVRSGERAWVLISYTTVPETVVNATFTALGAGAKVVLSDTTFPLAAAGITFTANSQVLDGQGRGTFIDGDALATNIHAINLSGYTDCIIKNLSVQTEDAGGKNCECIFIEDGAHRFRVENVTIVNSDQNGITVEGTNIAGGWITACEILDCDEIGIRLFMDNANGLADCKISLCRISCGGIGIWAFYVIHCTFEANYLYTVGSHGIYLDYADYCIVVANHLRDIFNDGILIFISDNVTVEGNEVRDTGDVGIHVDGGGGVNTQIVGNILDANQIGIHIQYSGTNTIINDNCILASLDYGIYFQGSVGSPIITCLTNGNLIQNVGSDGIRVTIYVTGLNFVGNYINSAGNYGIYVDSATNFTSIVENYINDCGYSGIRFRANADLLHIEGNYIYGNGTAVGNWYGIHLDSNSESNIQGNTIIANDLDGIFLEGDSDNNFFSDNFITDNGRYGINISVNTCDNNRVVDNHLLGNTTGCINDVGTDTELPEIIVYVAEPNGTIGRHPCVVLTDDVEVTVRFEIHIPSLFQELVRARVVVVPGATGDMNRGVETQWGKIGTEVYNATADTIAAGVVGVTINILEAMDVAAALDGIDGGDNIGLEFTRYGAAGTDTINADCYLLKFNMQYV